MEQLAEIIPGAGGIDAEISMQKLHLSSKSDSGPTQKSSRASRWENKSYRRGKPDFHTGLMERISIDYAVI